MTDLVLIDLLVQDMYLVLVWGVIYVASLTNLSSCFLFSYLVSKEHLDTRLKVLFWFGFVIWDFFLPSRQPHCLPWTNTHMQMFQILTVLALS